MKEKMEENRKIEKNSLKPMFPQWPIYDERELDNLKEVLESRNWWRVTGSKVKEFEKQFAEFQDSKYCIGVTNGTNALELALTVLEVGYGDEIIIPALTFVSTALAIINCNATPVLVDIDEDTLCLDVNKLEQAITSKTKVIIPVHMAGNACEMKKICDIAKKYNLYVIEDAAHAHGAEYQNRRIGSLGDMSIFSFQNGKLMTCGEGGALLINDVEMYEKAFLIQDVGRPKGDKVYCHLVRGANYRMNEFQAAILLAQLKRVDEYNQLREENAKYLDKKLSEIKGIKPQMRNADTNIMSHYMYMFYYDKKYFNGIERNVFVEMLNSNGIPASVCFPSISELDFVRKHEFNGKILEMNTVRIDSNEISNKVAKEVVWLHHRILEGNQEDISCMVSIIRRLQIESYI